MPQGQNALGPEYAVRVICLTMPKRPKFEAEDPAASEIQRLAGERLRAIRLIANINQTEIAEIIGVDQSTWSKWENGKREPSLLAVIRFASRAQASLDLIYLGVPTGSNPLLVQLLRASAPGLLVPEPTDTVVDMDTVIASYRSTIQQTATD